MLCHTRTHAKHAAPGMTSGCLSVKHVPCSNKSKSPGEQPAPNEQEPGGWGGALSVEARRRASRVCDEEKMPCEVYDDAQCAALAGRVGATTDGGGTRGTIKCAVHECANAERALQKCHSVGWLGTTGAIAV